ncbi:MAG: FKBP-type peptidyl-prolyl cis-trans isomerase [Frankiaceae bacterium]|nr:FKBP-type peptidyl-prolyl cis-trans isomerase [Frankiaceae bacterium]
MAAVVVSGCGGSSGGDLDSQSDAGSSADPSPGVQGPVAGSPGTGCTNDATAGKVTTTTDLSKKPVIDVPDGPIPCELDVQDIVEGTGPAAKAGDQLTMKYVGVLYADGKQFDASWDRGSDFPFTLGGGNVIQGWDQGMVGMKKGGRRQLVIPPDLGYGDQGAGADIPPGATLIFVVDLVKIG